MKKLFKISDFNNKITEIQVIKETNTTIWYISEIGKKRQERKNTIGHKHFETYKEAKDYLIKLYECRVNDCKNNLAYVELKLNELLSN